MARRVALRTSLRASDSITEQGLSQLAMLLFCAWVAELRATRIGAMRLEARKLAEDTAAAHKKRVFASMKGLMVADVRSLTHLALNEWLIVAGQSRMNSQMSKLEAAKIKLAMQKDKLVRAKAAAFFGHAHSKPMHKAVFLAWVAITEEAVLAQKAMANEMPQQHETRECALSQWLQFLIECGVVERGRLLLPEVLGAWQRSTWNFLGSRERLRKTALHIGHGVIACGEWNLAVHVILAWRQAAMTTAVDRMNTRLQSALVLLQALSRAFFAALRHWEGRAA